jgi:hypothetical protein
MGNNSELKNPIFWCTVAFFLGIGLAAWGWDKNESTIAARTHGAVAMIIVGCVLTAGGLIGWFTIGNKRQ